MKCTFGHVLSQAALENGLTAVLSDPVRLPAPWAPRHGESFLRVSRWVHGKNTLRWTELRAQEEDPLRRAEWVRARDLFYRFVSQDQATKIELDRVVYLDNPALEVRPLAVRLLLSPLAESFQRVMERAQ